MKNLATAVLAIALGSTGSAHAFDLFDGKRGGLQLSLGMGMGSTVVDYQSAESGDKFQSNNLAASAQLGIGLNDYLSVHVGGISARVDNGTGGQKLSTIGGVGATWYLARSAASLYVTGTYGKGFLRAPEDERNIESSAPAWMIGGGYELSSHLQVQATYASSGSTVEGEATTNDFRATYLTARYVFY